MEQNANQIPDVVVSEGLINTGDNESFITKGLMSTNEQTQAEQTKSFVLNG
jgi:hypothetical protein